MTEAQVCKTELFPANMLRPFVSPGQFGIHNNYISEIKLQQIDLLGS